MFLNIPGEIKLSQNCRRKSQIHGELCKPNSRRSSWLTWGVVHNEPLDLGQGLFPTSSGFQLCCWDSAQYRLATQFTSPLCQLRAVGPQVSSLASLCLAALSVKGPTPHCDDERTARSNSQKALRNCCLKRIFNNWQLHYYSGKVFLLQQQLHDKSTHYQ